MAPRIFHPGTPPAEKPPDARSKVRSRLKAQRTKFREESCGSLSKSQRKFVAEMLCGIYSRQDVKLRNIGRAPAESTPPIRTEKRSSRNLKHAKSKAELTTQLADMASIRVQNDTLPALKPSDIHKEYATLKMEYLATVWDGSSGETHPGYWLVDVTAAEVHGSEIVPACQKLFSTKANEYVSENAEILKAVDAVNHSLNGSGIWTADCGCDRKKLLEPLLTIHRQRRWLYGCWPLKEALSQPVKSNRNSGSVAGQ